MSVKIRKKSFKRKLTGYILLLTIAAVIIFSVNSFFSSSNHSFISPLGKTNIDKSGVEKSLNNYGIKFSEVVVLSDSSYIVSISSNGQVRFSSQKNIDKQVSSLQRIVKQLTIEGKSFKSIDFRFNESIVSF